VDGRSAAQRSGWELHLQPSTASEISGLRADRSEPDPDRTHQDTPNYQTPLSGDFRGSRSSLAFGSRTTWANTKKVGTEKEAPDRRRGWRLVECEIQ
jgi:hypothetical protein